MEMRAGNLDLGKDLDPDASHEELPFIEPARRWQDHDMTVAAKVAPAAIPRTNSCSAEQLR